MQSQKPRAILLHLVFCFRNLITLGTVRAKDCAWDASSGSDKDE